MTYSEFTNLVLQEISQLLSLNQFNVTLSPYPNQAGGKLNSIHSVIPPPHSLSYVKVKVPGLYQVSKHQGDHSDHWSTTEAPRPSTYSSTNPNCLLHWTLYEAP